MTISALVEFVTLAKCLNYTAAANKLFISQPTLSKHINSMETELGSTLFERTRHETRLTETGHRLLTSAKQIVEIYDTLLSDLALYSKGIQGRLTLGILSHDATNIVAPIIHLLAKELPTIKISVCTQRPSTMLNALLSGQIDVADMFHTADVAGKSSLCFHDYGSEGFSVLLPRRHPLANKETIYLNDLNNEPFVWHHSDPGLVNYEKKFLAAHKIRPSQEYFADQVDTLPLSILIYRAVAIVNRRASDFLNPDIVARDIANEDFRVNIAFAWKKNSNNPCLRSFAEALKKHSP